MHVAIVGSRTYPNPGQVAEFVMQLSPDSVVVSGAAPGVDSWALHVADAIGLEWIAIPADWATYGRSAGFRRNPIIVSLADRVAAFHYRASSGTGHTISLARKAGLPLDIFEL